MKIRRVLKWSAFILVDFTVALLAFWVHSSWPQRAVYFHPWNSQADWLNVTPGYPDTVPTLWLMGYSPYPLPKEENFAAITPVSISRDAPVILKGRPNRTRFWSFVLYPLGAQKHNAALPTIHSGQIVFEADGSYVITLGPARANKNWLDTGATTQGILFMRNYVPVAGERITLPDVFWGDRLVTSSKAYHYAN